MNLYRTVGLQELGMIYDGDMKAFPAGLPQQPIFYPVLQLEYARQVAADWNIRNGEFAGYITKFSVDDQYIGRFEEHTIGDSSYQELWIPSEEVEEFNKHITGQIRVVEAYFGEAFNGFVPEKFGLQGKGAVEQFTTLANTYIYKRMDFYLEIRRNHKAIFLNYPFWQKYSFKNPGLKEKILKAIKEAWLTSFPKIPLVNYVQEDINSLEQLDPPSTEDAIQEETNSSIRSDRQSLAPPVQEDGRLIKEATPGSLSNLVHQETRSAKQTDSQLQAHPVREGGTLLKPPEKNSLRSLDQQHTDSVRQEESNLSQKPVSEQPKLLTRPIPHFLEGVKLGLSGKYREAIYSLTKAVEEDPNQAGAYTSLGVAFHNVGEDARALSCYESALKINPKYADARYFQANILYSRGDVREAIAGYTVAVGLVPELIDAHQAYSVQDRLTDYISLPAEMYRIAKSAHLILDLNRKLEINPEGADLFKERAAEYCRLWNFEQAIADYSSSLVLQPDDANALHFRGSAYEQIGQKDRALQDFQRAIVINPHLADEYINRGIAHAKVGNFRQAIVSLTEAIRLAPRNPDIYFNRGMSYYQYGDQLYAIDDFSNVIRLSPEDEEAYYWRGISNEEAGNNQEATADYLHFLELTQNVDAKEDVEQRLKRWNDEKRRGATSGKTDPTYMKRIVQAEAEKPEQDLHLYNLTIALGERALRSTWFGSGVDGYGETAEELSSLTDHNLPVQGEDFIRIASGIRQLNEGEFIAFDPGSVSHWVLIRIWRNNGFYIEIDDPMGKERLKTYFQSVEEVEGADPSFESLFIHF